MQTNLQNLLCAVWQSWGKTNFERYTHLAITLQHHHNVQLHYDIIYVIGQQIQNILYNDLQFTYITTNATATTLTKQKSYFVSTCSEWVPLSNTMVELIYVVANNQWEVAILAAYLFMLVRHSHVIVINPCTIHRVVIGYVFFDSSFCLI